MNLPEIPWLLLFFIVLLVVAIRDRWQKKHTIRHNFPVVGHLRYWLESIGPELRQYIVANNREELPFNRQQRAWIYASSKKENNYTGFGTDQDLHAPGYVFIKPSLLPFRPSREQLDQMQLIPAAKTFGTRRKRPYRPASIINISAMSYGSLSKQAVESLNRGALLAGCYHNTGEGGFAPAHQHGADVVFHLGTGYFGARNLDGTFSLEKLVELTQQYPKIRMIEIKLSQGAKPGKGGVLPGKKVTAEIAAIRGIPEGKDALSPAYHTTFDSIPTMVHWLESIGDATGLPVGIKAAVGKLDYWEELADYMATTQLGPDFITIDGGEGGTGAAPRSFADHVSLPWVDGFSKVYQIFSRHHLTDRIAFIGSGKLGLPDSAILAMAMGADVIQVAREAMLSIGCIQAKICHTNRCPVGIATNNQWLTSGLDPTLKSVRFAHYIQSFSKEVMEITHACGYEHPSQFTMDDIEVSMGNHAQTATLRAVYGYQKKGQN